MDQNINLIGRNLQKIMNKKFFKARELANMVGISSTHLSYVMNNKRQASPQLLEKIAAALDVSVDRLTGEAASNIIEDRLEETGMTLDEVAEKTGVSLHWLQNLDSFMPGEWANGEIEYNWITKVAKVLGLPGSQLRTALARQEIPIYKGQRDSPENDFADTLVVKESPQSYEFDSSYLKRVPLVGRTAAGNPITAIENPGEYIVIDTRINKVNGNDISEYFALEVAGHSMEPTIHDGEIILIKRQPIIELGQIGVFRCNGDEATVKRFGQEGNKIYLIPDNKQFPVQEYTTECECIGRVIESIRRKIM